MTLVVTKFQNQVEIYLVPPLDGSSFPDLYCSFKNRRLEHTLLQNKVKHNNL
jgi:hypothetical protein